MQAEEDLPNCPSLWLGCSIDVSSHIKFLCTSILIVHLFIGILLNVRLLLCLPQVQYEEDADQLTFCQRVTAEQYDRERRGTSGSLLSLLDTIIGDTRMSKKDKMKRLRQVSQLGGAKAYTSRRGHPRCVTLRDVA